MFQSPSRGGHLRGPAPRAPAALLEARFSPLHEGDTSVAHLTFRLCECASKVSVPFTRGTPPWRRRRRADTGRLLHVSVPFTRGTPPWPAGRASSRSRFAGFSPLHEGDTSVA